MRSRFRADVRRKRGPRTLKLYINKVLKQVRLRDLSQTKAMNALFHETPSSFPTSKEPSLTPFSAFIVGSIDRFTLIALSARSVRNVDLQTYFRKWVFLNASQVFRFPALVHGF